MVWKIRAERLPWQHIYASRKVFLTPKKQPSPAIPLGGNFNTSDEWRAHEYLKLETAVPVILILGGGSLKARIINDAVIKRPAGFG